MQSISRPLGRRGSPWTGLGVVVAKETADHLSGARMVALTGYGQSEDVRRSREVGFDHHLTKPVDFVALEAVLGGLLTV